MFKNIALAAAVAVVAFSVAGCSGNFAFGQRSGPSPHMMAGPGPGHGGPPPAGRFIDEDDDMPVGPRGPRMAGGPRIIHGGPIAPQRIITTHEPTDRSGRFRCDVSGRRYEGKTAGAGWCAPRSKPAHVPAS